MNNFLLQVYEVWPDVIKLFNIKENVTYLEQWRLRPL